MREDRRSLGQLLALLTEKRRRYALYHLNDAETRTVTLDELADQIVTWEDRWERNESAKAERRANTRVTLHHNHLPKLADADLIDYDTRNRIVTVRRVEELSTTDWVQSNQAELPHLRALFLASYPE